MSYITQSDLSSLLSDRKLIELTDDNRTGIVATAIVTKAIADAEAEANGYLATRYRVPIAGTVPDLVKKLCVDVAVYNLYRRRVVPENIRTAYEDAVKKLGEIAKGIITLGIDPPPATSSHAAQGEVFGEERQFSREKLSGF
jgi:phage gp36-like protein